MACAKMCFFLTYLRCWENNTHKSTCRLFSFLLSLSFSWTPPTVPSPLSETLSTHTLLSCALHLWLLHPISAKSVHRRACRYDATPQETCAPVCAAVFDTSPVPNQCIVTTVGLSPECRARCVCKCVDADDFRDALALALSFALALALSVALTIGEMSLQASTKQTSSPSRGRRCGSSLHAFAADCALHQECEKGLGFKVWGLGENARRYVSRIAYRDAVRRRRSRGRRGRRRGRRRGKRSRGRRERRKENGDL